MYEAKTNENNAKMSDYSFKLEQLPTTDDLVEADNDRPQSLYDNLSDTITNSKPKPQIPVKPAKKFQFNDIKFQFEEIPSDPVLLQTSQPAPSAPPLTSSSSNAPPSTAAAANQNQHNNNNHKQYNDNDDDESLQLSDLAMKHQQTQAEQSRLSTGAHPTSSLDNNSTGTIRRDYINYNNKNNTSDIFDSGYVGNQRMNKSVLSDAKLVFFGLNGTGTSPSAPSDPNNRINNNKSAENMEPFSDNSLRLNPMRMPAAADPSTSPITPPPDYPITPSEDLHNTNETSQLMGNGNGDRRATILDDGKQPNTQNGNNHSNDNINNNNRSLKYQLPETFKMNHQNTPSQAVYMSTTVPQNIKSNNIIGRHTPTRTSLRHSRMLVVNKNYQARRMNQLQIKCPILAKISLICKVVIGICLCSISLWLLLWAPNTRMRDDPYWSGILLIVSGILGIIIVEFKSTRQSRMKTNCFNFLKINSTIITILTLFFTVLAFIYAFIHFHNLTIGNKQCVPENSFSPGSPCICNFGINNDVMNATSIFFGSTGFELHYRDLNCMEVLGPWYYIIMASTILNFLGFIFCAIYLTLFSIGCNKQPEQEYSNVRTNPS